MKSSQLKAQINKNNRLRRTQKKKSNWLNNNIKKSANF